MEYEAVFEKVVYSITYDETGVTYEAKKEEPVIIPEVPEPEPMEVRTNPDSYTIEEVKNNVLNIQNKDKDNDKLHKLMLKYDIMHDLVLNIIK